MSHLPKLAIVGRPNVGKSALFNQICKKRIAIVDEAEGVTRDRIYCETDLFGLKFEVIDTGGIDAKSKALFNEEIKRQAEIAIEEADSLVMVVDALVGITELDRFVARVLLKTKKPVCLAVNKIDNMSQVNLIHQFHGLGIKNIIPVSAAQGWRIAELLETALKDLPKKEEDEDLDSIDALKIAVVGRPNVGKSSLINYFLEDNRCIVSPIPGTTRDSIDTFFTYEDVPYVLIDTAGIRRKKSEPEVVDKFAAIRTERAIERADLCLLVLDVQQGLTAQDKKIANMIEEAGKGCILLFNKWDLVKGFRMEHCLKDIQEQIPFLSHCPKLCISATTGRNVEKIIPLVQDVATFKTMRISTGQLNKFLERAIQKNHPPMLKGKRLRIYYMAQVDVAPPKFIFFVNNPGLMTDGYKKYLYNQFREEYQFSGMPLLFFLKGKEKKERDENDLIERKNNRKLAPAVRTEDESEDEFYEDESGDYDFDDDDEE